jgi:hypothetical protein
MQAVLFYLENEILAYILIDSDSEAYCVDIGS